MKGCLLPRGKTQCHLAGVAEADSCSLEYNTDSTPVMLVLDVGSGVAGNQECQVPHGGYGTVPEGGNVLMKYEENSYYETLNTETSSTGTSGAQTATTKPMNTIPSGSHVGRITTRPGMVTWSRQDDGLHVCRLCSYASKYRSDQVNHSRTHTGERPFPCDLCPQAFTRRSNLLRHRLTHTGERPHVCTICRAAFPQRAPLKRHMRIHTEERPYRCATCNRRFSDRSNFSRHVVLHMK